MSEVERDDDSVTKIIKAHFVKYGSYPTKIVDSENDRRFYESKRIREFLSRAFGAEITRAYYLDSTRPDYALYGTASKPWALDLSMETYYIITKSGNILRMTNSEWGQLRIADNLKD